MFSGSVKITWDFHREKSLADRLILSGKLHERFSGKVYIILQQSSNSNLGKFAKLKYIVPIDNTVADLYLAINRETKLTPSQAFFLFFGEKQAYPPMTARLGDLNAKYADSDGFLYVMYSGENVFG